MKSIQDLRVKIKLQQYNYYNFKYVLEKAERFFEILHIIKNKKQILFCCKCHSEVYNGTLEKDIYITEIKRLKKAL